MESACGIAHIPYGAKIAYRSLPDNSTLGAAAKKAPRPLVDSVRTVQRLHELGALNNQEMQSVLQLEAIVDEQIKIASAEKERIPFAVWHRVIQMYFWASSISKALEYVGKPYNPSSKTVNNLPLPTEEGDDKKRKASRSLSGLTTNEEEDDTVEEKIPPQQQAENKETDRQSPGGSGGNPV